MALESASFAASARRFQAKMDSVANLGRLAKAEGLRLRLTKLFPKLVDNIPHWYIHPKPVEGSELLKGQVPAAVLDHALKDGIAVLSTNGPRYTWLAMQSNVTARFCLGTVYKDDSVWLYKLEDIQETELWSIMEPMM